jgi:cytochrome bd-type quinol oxidase subunit 2
MKLIKIITHPALLISSFCLIIISGEHWGGFYLLYLLLALPHGGIHAMIAVAGIILLLLNKRKHSSFRRYKIQQILYITGAICLVLSLYLFFHNDPKGYNLGTFEQWVPLISLALFGLLATGFVSYHFMLLLSANKSLMRNFH